MRPRVLRHDVTGDGEPLVLVPGGLTGWLSWIPHAERLGATRRVIRVQPIHNELGSAGQPGDLGYTAETERESLRLTLDELGAERADFAGWSGGGRALLEFAIAYPDRVRTLTLVEPAAYWILEELGEEVEEVSRINAFVYALAGTEVSEDDLCEFLRSAGLVQPGEDPRQHPAWERWAPHRMALSWQSERLDRAGRAVEELEAIRCPVLLVEGTLSTATDRRLVGVLAERLANATVLELEGDHACHIESIDAFLEALDRHLAGGGLTAGAVEG
jgi:pimeloyl-ACP methyl ester carboxylesterase